MFESVIRSTTCAKALSDNKDETLELKISSSTDHNHKKLTFSVFWETRGSASHHHDNTEATP